MNTKHLICLNSKCIFSLFFHDQQRVEEVVHHGCCDGGGGVWDREGWLGREAKGWVVSALRSCAIDS